jgi:hypothetical protein
MRRGKREDNEYIHELRKRKDEMGQLTVETGHALSRLRDEACLTLRRGVPRLYCGPNSRDTFLAGRYRN